MRQRLLAVLALAALAALCGCGSGPAGPPPPARAWDDPGFVSRGEWTLYYSAMRSTDLPPELAKEYGVAGDPSRGLVVVSLKRGTSDAMADASVAITIRSLDGVSRPVAVQRVEREGARSWLGVFTSNGRELLSFAVTARPASTEPAITAEFRRELFVD